MFFVFKLNSNDLIIDILGLIILLRVLIIKLGTLSVIIITLESIHWKLLDWNRTCHVFVGVESPVSYNFCYCCHLQNILLLNEVVLGVVEIVIIPLVMLVVVLVFIIILL